MSDLHSIMPCHYLNFEVLKQKSKYIKLEEIIEMTYSFIIHQG